MVIGILVNKWDLLEYEYEFAERDLYNQIFLKVYICKFLCLHILNTVGVTLSKF